MARGQTDIATYIPGQPPAGNNGWQVVKSGIMSLTAARNWFNDLKATRSVRMFRGAKVGRLVGAHYRPEDIPELSKVQTPANLVEIDPN